MTMRGTRVPMIAGNWKMNTLHEEAVALARAVRERSDGIRDVEVVLCPPAVHLRDVCEAVAGSQVRVGGQNVHWAENGAYTGEISPPQLAEVAEYAIIGHSERRQFFGETDETVNRRVRGALAGGLKPIMCVGELLAQRERHETAEVLVRQTRAGLDGVDVDPAFVVAYEPVWAIGTGLAADGPTAQEAVALIRSTVREIAGAVADEVRILYGGSVTPENIAEFMAQPDIDGALVGGASLKADAFCGIIEATAAARARG
jgi:triosephosphate isomerase